MAPKLHFSELDTNNQNWETGQSEKRSMMFFPVWERLRVWGKRE